MFKIDVPGMGKKNKGLLYSDETRRVVHAASQYLTLF